MFRSLGVVWRAKVAAAALSLTVTVAVLLSGLASLLTPTASAAPSSQPVPPPSPATTTRAAIGSIGSAGVPTAPLALLASQCLAVPSDQIGWWTGDGTLRDEQGNNHGTLQGRASYAPGLVGPAFWLDGTNSYVNLGNTPGVQVSSGDFTVEAWVNFATLTGGDKSIVDKMSTTGEVNSDGWRVLKQTDNRIWFCLGGGTQNGCGPSGLTVTTPPIVAGAWYHVAAVKTASTIAIYLNGALAQSSARSPFTDTHNANLRIGSSAREGAYLPGLVDEVGLYSRALGGGEIQAIFNAGANGKCKRTAPCQGVPSGLAGWWPGEGSPVDLRSGGRGTLHNGTAFTAGVVGQAFRFDGGDEYVNLGNAPQLQVSAGAFTVEAWVLFNDLGSGQVPLGDMSILDKMSGGNTDGWRLLKQTDNRIWFCLGGGTIGGCWDGSPLTAFGPPSIPLVPGVWFHVVAVKSASAITVYINGVAGESKPLTPFTDTHRAELQIGKTASTAIHSSHLNGWVDEPTLYAQDLSVPEIRGNFTIGNGGKCKPPLGQFEGAARQADGTGVRVQGWGLDLDTTGPVTVRVRDNGAAVRDEVAQVSRPDIGSLHPGYGDAHGFDVVLAEGPQPNYGVGPHTLCVDVLNVGPDGPVATALGCKYVREPREEQARAWLQASVAFRTDISPYQGGPVRFDDLVRRFDQIDPASGKVGFDKPYAGSQTLGQRLAQAEQELGLARDQYAWLVAHANAQRYRTYQDDPADPADPTYAALCGQAENPNATPPVVDWCDFGARLRQTARELATLRLLFGQEFTVDALGPQFGSSLVGGEDAVRDEVDSFQQALTQYQLAATAVLAEVGRPVDNGCAVADYYTTSEWDLLARAAEGSAQARRETALRQSYLSGSGGGPALAQQTYHAAALDAYTALLGAAGLAVRPPVAPVCGGTRPSSDVLAALTADVQATQQRAQDLAAGRNVFGFDTRLTPARPYRTAVGSNDTGLWDEARMAADLAKVWQGDASQASRDFDLSQNALHQALLDVTARYDDRLRDLTGCSRAALGSDTAFFACVAQVPATLATCPLEGTQADYDACVAAVPTGLLRQNTDAMRAALLRVRRVQQAIDNVPQRIDVEVGRNATVNHVLFTNGQEQSLYQYALAQLESVGVSTSFSIFPPGVSVGVSFNPNAPQIGTYRQLMTMREVAAQVEVNDANSEAVVRTLWLDLGELWVDLDVAAQEANAQASAYRTAEAETKDLAVEAQRARRFTEQSSLNDPALRLARDEARLRLANQLEYATRVAYMAAKRAEYEYATPLNGLALSPGNVFRFAEVYQARTADDVLAFLTRLKGLTDNLLVPDAEVQQEDFTLSVALHLLGLTDENLGLTGDAARAERIHRFREWVAQHTAPNAAPGGDGKPVLTFGFTTSVAAQGVFSQVILQGYDRFWLHQVGGVQKPKPANTGVELNLITTQPANLQYRRVVVTQAGTTHLRARDGCVLDYRLVHPAALLGLNWPTSQPPESVTTDFKAAVNSAGGEHTAAFLARPVSATDWQVQVFAGAPQGGLGDMDLQQLTDLELRFSTTRASRDAGQPPVGSCARSDS